MGQRSMIEHQDITHVDNTYWRRGVQAVLERLPDLEQSCSQQRRLCCLPSNQQLSSNLICAAPRHLPFPRHLSILHTQRFLACSSHCLPLVVLNGRKNSRRTA